MINVSFLYLKVYRLRVVYLLYARGPIGSQGVSIQKSIRQPIASGGLDPMSPSGFAHGIQSTIRISHDVAFTIHTFNYL